MNTSTVTAHAAEVSFAIVEVTPKQAQIWLGLNTSNRKLKPGQVTAFAEDMKAGRWALNGEAIKLAGPAYAPTKLLDGQNRLHAVLKAGVPVTLAVAFGVSATAQSTMDSGTKRTVADNLSIGGISHGAVLAAAAGIAVRAATGRLGGGPVKATNAAIEEFIYENPSLIRSARISASLANKADVPASLVAYTHWVFSAIDPIAAEKFWRDAAEKVGLEYGDPVIAMTNRFAQARRVRERIAPEAAVSAIFRTWNHRRAGKSSDRMQINPRKGSPVIIPKVI